ncbi:MAG: hypothetical protein VB082_10770 [Christensenella sp.]|nr:hypothetical protein [Christensenella sp.]
MVESRKKGLFWVKIAVVIVFFLATQWISSRQILYYFDGRVMFDRNMVENLASTMIFFYALTWLYRWVVRDSLRGWHLQSAAAVGVGVLLRMVADLCYLPFYMGAGDKYATLNASRSYNLIYDVFCILSVVIFLLLLFFWLDGRAGKPMARRTKSIRILSVALMVGTVVCAAAIVLVTWAFTPVTDFVHAGDLLAMDKEAQLLYLISFPWRVELDVALGSLVLAFGTAVFAMLFLLLWVGTAPGKRTALTEENEPRDLGEYTKECKPKRTAKKAKVSVREWVRKNKL